MAGVCGSPIPIMHRPTTGILPSVHSLLAHPSLVKPARVLTDLPSMSEDYMGPERRADAESSDRRRPRADRRSGMDRRRGPGRRRGEVRRAAEEGEITGELLDFIMAIDEYKRVNDRPFPSWSEVFEIVHYLGYRKVAPIAQHINTASDAEALESHAGAGEAERSLV